mgnify:CR=1 FL=1
MRCQGVRWCPGVVWLVSKALGRRRRKLAPRRVRLRGMVALVEEAVLLLALRLLGLMRTTIHPHRRRVEMSDGGGRGTEIEIQNLDARIGAAAIGRRRSEDELEPVLSPRGSSAT